MTDFAICTTKLTRRFRRTVAVDELNLEVPPGAIYALVGPNGAGKTTLIKLLMNILRPTSGIAEVMGIDSRLLTGSQLESIGYVSENQEMPEGMTVGGMLAYLRSFYPTWDRGLEQQLLRRFELPVERKLKHLSRGMWMKAAFISSLAYRPRLLVLDEPFSGLDPLVREELIEMILESSPESTIFLSSHDLAEIENVASHIGFLSGGRLLCSEEIEHLSGRFRQVNVALEDSARLPDTIPHPWLDVQTANRAVSFVHSGYSAGDSESEVAALFPSSQKIEFAPMNLRAIFVAVAKSARRGAVNTTNDAKENQA